MARPSILIVGAGPTGLTAALELARRGYSARIVDRDAGPTSLSKAVGVSPHSLDILEPSGVTERLLARGLRIRQAQARYEGKLLAAIDLTRLPHRFNFLLSLPQAETERLMEVTLAGFGGHVDWRTELKDIRLVDRGADVELLGPGGAETARYDYVFGADSAHSRVRQALGMGFSGYAHKRLWSIADAEIPGWPYPPETAEAVLHRNGDLGFIIPIGEGRFRAVSNTPEPLAHVPGTQGAKVLGQDTFHIPVKQADRYRAGGVFLGGDAAHVHSPIGARGMNLGIEDAAAFARRLAEDDLDGYEAERRPVGRRWMDLSERVLAAVQADSWGAVAARNLALSTLGHFPAAQKPMLERVAGLRE
jgi:2-polyprenyl-6-methoxyphenol hydroxylase-like FAD-dependent oxidoreductase